VPPRTVATAVDKHREVRRQRTGNETFSQPPPPPPPPAKDEEAAFSDDSLEGAELAQQPPSLEIELPVQKRGSIAWEVSLDDPALMTPGSTKVVGRRRKYSNDCSSMYFNVGVVLIFFSIDGLRKKVKK